MRLNPFLSNFLRQRQFQAAPKVLRPADSKKRMLEALQGLAWDDLEFRPERSQDTGRPVEL